MYKVCVFLSSVLISSRAKSCAQVAFKPHSAKACGQQQRRSMRPVMAASKQSPDAKMPAIFAAAALAAAAAFSPLNAEAISGGGGEPCHDINGLDCCGCRKPDLSRYQCTILSPLWALLLVLCFVKPAVQYEHMQLFRQYSETSNFPGLMHCRHWQRDSSDISGHDRQGLQEPEAVQSRLARHKLHQSRHARGLPVWRILQGCKIQWRGPEQRRPRECRL